MKRKPITQLDAIKAIRKPIPPKTRVERPKRGGGYRCKKRSYSPFDDPEDYHESFA